MDNKAMDMAKDTALLVSMLMQRLPHHGDFHTDIPELVLHRRDIVQKPENCFNKPTLAVTVQGAKRTVVGNEEYRYGAGNSLLAGVDMPSMSYITEASAEKPYLVLALTLDSHLTAQLAAQLPATQTQSTVKKGTAVSPTDPEILKAFLRLMELLDKPEQIPVLAPIILREIHLRLLLGPMGGVLKSLNTQGTQSNQVFQGINWLRENFQEPLNVEALARFVNMAPPTFRKHFKAVTTMSPTQYHKHLRLYEAQRRMLEQHEDATSAGYAVGYESLTQFNREYKRLFGEPPARNVSHLAGKANGNKLNIRKDA